MKRITILSITLVALLSATGRAETKSDYDHHYRLAASKVWDFKSDGNRTSDQFGRNSLWDQRLRDEMVGKMAAGGFRIADGTRPDIVVDYHLNTQRGIEREFYTTAFPGYYGRFGRRGGWFGYGPGWSETTVRTTPELRSMLVMDVYDARTRQLIWRGYDTETINYNKADNAIDHAVDHLMKKFTHEMKSS